MCYYSCFTSYFSVKDLILSPKRRPGRHLICSVFSCFGLSKNQPIISNVAFHCWEESNNNQGSSKRNQSKIVFTFLVPFLNLYIYCPRNSLYESYSMWDGLADSVPNAVSVQSAQFLQPTSNQMCQPDVSRAILSVCFFQCSGSIQR